MEDFENLKEEKKPKYLKNVHFGFEGAHIALTSKGAASMKDEPYLLKSLDRVPKESLDEDATSSEGGDTGETADNDVSKNQNTKNEEDMTDTVSKEAFVALQKKLVAKEIQGYGFEAELQKSLTDVMVAAGDEQSEVIVKALDAVISAKDAEKEEALEKAKGEVVEQEENPVAKALSQEEGHAEQEPDVTVTKTRTQMALEAREAKEGDK